MASKKELEKRIEQNERVIDQLIFHVDELKRELNEMKKPKDDYMG